MSETPSAPVDAAPPAQAEPAGIYLSIDGMTCASCVRRVEDALRSVPGVASASVSLATRRARVTAGPDGASVEKLEGAVAAAGYRARPAPAELTTGEEEVLQEARTWLFRLAFGLVFSLPLVVLSMAHGLAVRPEILLALAAPVQAVVGWPFYRGAWRRLLSFSANMDTLVAVGSTAAFGYSLATTFFPPGEPYYEGAATILTFVSIGKYLEGRSRWKASRALRRLLSLRPKTARVIRGGAESEIPVDEIRAGDRVVVRPGERLPADGIVREGTSAVDESLLTGESLPAEKKPDDEVFGGSLNGHGSFTLEATRIGRETLLQQIVALVEEAQASKTRIERLADRISAVFVPAVMGVAVLTFGGWLAFGPADGAIRAALLNATAVLLIACPCALGLATPIAVIAGTARGAELGILIRRAEALEAAGRIQAVLLDKTGTLTRGEPDVVGMTAAAGVLERDLLSAAAAAELRSEHPLAKAVVRKARAEGLEPPAPEEFRAYPGLGVRARSGGIEILVGTRDLFRQKNVDCSALADGWDRAEAAGRTVFGAASGGRFLGFLEVADPLKPGSREAVSELRAMGLRVLLITGDNEKTARAIGAEAGIEEVHARVLPAMKARKVADLKAQGLQVAMVGDGVNDAPALAAADLGIAIGTGADVAAEAADVTIVSGDPRGVPRAILLARATLAKIRQNLFLAFLYNGLGIPLAALGLLTPMHAAAAMALSSVSVVANALLLRRAGIAKRFP